MSKTYCLIFFNLFLFSCSNEPVDCGNLINKINSQYDGLIEEAKKIPDASKEVLRLNKERARKINQAYSECYDIHSEEFYHEKNKR